MVYYGDSTRPSQRLKAGERTALHDSALHDSAHHDSALQSSAHESPPGTADEGALPEAQLDDAWLLTQRPRPHHYHLVHYVLRMVAFTQPVDCLGHLASEGAEEFVEHLWDMTVECCPDDAGAPDFAPADIDVHIARIGEYPCAVVEMPPPRKMTEAYFAGLLIPVELDELADGRTEVPLRYFTLEYTVDERDAASTVLCEWTADGDHLNGGSGPEPTLGAFLQAIALRLEP